jgi:hypothetical protein
MMQADRAGHMFSDVLRVCLDNGFQLPLYVAAVGINGSVMFFRFTDGGDHLIAEPLVDHDAGTGGLVLPINIMVSDARGEAVRVVIGRDGEATFH